MRLGHGTRTRLAPVLCATVSVLLLAGCGDDRNELREWMDGVRASTHAVRETIAEPRPFEPFRYERSGEADPFAPTRLVGLVFDQAPADARARSGLSPDTERMREPLEQHPLDALRMVGHLSNGRQSFALLQVAGVVHQVRVGNHAGQNSGVITHVDEKEVRLRELVQDAGGEWVHREARLRLHEETPK
jgi:type IV pilus assembly protein PilP